MALNEITVSTIPGFTGTNSQEVAWEAANVPDGNYYLSTGREVVMVRNVSVNTNANVTVPTVDGYDDFVETIPFGTVHVLPMFNLTRYRQTNRTVLLTGATTDVQFIVLRLPT